jgi:hypothetical protein
MSLNLVLNYEASAVAAPQSFRDAMQTAVNILDATIKDNITVTIQVGYNDYYNNQITNLGTSAVGGDLYGSYVSYTSLRAALASHETSAVDQAFVNSLPNTTSVNGMSGFYIPSAVEKALGMISPTASAIDGAIGLGSGIPTGDLVGVALHEITHAMGREPGAGTFDLGRYTSAGNHLYSSGSTAPAAYFSIDGGVTRLADYGQNSDPSDFLNSGVQGTNDPFNEYYSGSTVQALSTVDKQLLDTLGFNTTGTAPSAPAAATSSIVVSSPTVIANGTSTTTLTVTVKDANGIAVAGTAVTLSGSGSSNNFGATSGTTDANGVFTTTLASTLAQTETITATEGSVHEQTSVTFVAGAPSAATSSLVASSPTVSADGTSTTTLTVTVKDVYGNAVAGTAVTLSASGSSNSFGALSGTTNANGVFTTTLASTLAQTETITATEGSVQEQTSVSFIAPATTVMEAYGSTELVQVGQNYFFKSIATGAGPELKFGGAAVVAGQFGTIAPIGAEQTGSGYDVAWKVPGADQFVVWSTDSSGNYLSTITGPSAVSGTSATLQTLETTFHQDLNGDGVVGVPPAPVVIEASGSTSLTQVGSNFYFYSGGSGPELKFGGAAVVAGQFGTIAPIGAEQTGSGYDVAWKMPGADQFVVWSTDSSGNYLSTISGPTAVSGTSATLQTLETTFHQDLNGDGVIGVPPATVVIEASGSTSLTQVGSNFYFYSGGSGPELKFGGAAVVAGQFGTIAPIGAEQTGSGYDVAWKVPGADQFVVWSTDSSGNYLSTISGPSAVSGTSATLKALETTFHQDLNSDGIIGVPSAPSPVAMKLEPQGAAPIQIAGKPAFISGQDTFVFAPNFAQGTPVHFTPEIDIQSNKLFLAGMDALVAAFHADSHGTAVFTEADMTTLKALTTAHMHEADFHLV